MACNLLDLKCIFVNELIGSITLTVILLIIGYFIIASKNKFGFETSMWVLCFVLLIAGIMFGNLAIFLGFISFIVAILIGIEFSNKIGN